MGNSSIYFIGIDFCYKIFILFCRRRIRIGKSYSLWHFRAGAVNYFYLLESLLLSIGIIKCRDELYSSENGVCLTNIAYCYVCFSFLTMRDATILRLIWYFSYRFYLCNFLIFCSLCRKDIFHIYQAYGLYFILPYCFFVYYLIWDGGDMMPYKTFLDNNFS